MNLLSLVFGFCLSEAQPQRLTGAVHEKQMPFLAREKRLAVRAVKGAGCAFIGAKRRPLTEGADGNAQGYAGRAEE